MNIKEEIMQKITALQEELKLYDQPEPKLGQVWRSIEGGAPIIITEIDIGGANDYMFMYLDTCTLSCIIGRMSDVKEHLEDYEFAAHNLTEYYTRRDT